MSTQGVKHVTPDFAGLSEILETRFRQDPRVVMAITFLLVKIIQISSVQFPKRVFLLHKDILLSWDDLTQCLSTNGARGGYI